MIIRQLPRNSIPCTRHYRRHPPLRTGYGGLAANFDLVMRWGENRRELHRAASLAERVLAGSSGAFLHSKDRMPSDRLLSAIKQGSLEGVELSHDFVSPVDGISRPRPCPNCRESRDPRLGPDATIGRVRMVPELAKRTAPCGAITHHSRLRRVMRSVALLIMAAVIAAMGAPVPGQAQTSFYAQPAATQTTPTYTYQQPASSGSQLRLSTAGDGAGPLSLPVSLPVLLSLLWVGGRLPVRLGCSVGLGMAFRRFRRIWRLLELWFSRRFFPPRLLPPGLRPVRLRPCRFPPRIWWQFLWWPQIARI